MTMKLAFSAALLTGGIPTALIAGPFDEAPVSDRVLASAYARGTPYVGLDQRNAAADAGTLPLFMPMPLASETIRDVMDLWNIQVAAPLIAEATRRAGAL